jgi:hypothetical protein
MSDMTVQPDVRRMLITRQLESWRNTFEDCRIGIIVADAIKDTERKKALQAEMERAVKAAEVLTALLAELPGEATP